MCGEFESPQTLLKVKQISTETKTHSLRYSAVDAESRGALRKPETKVDVELLKLLKNSTAEKNTDNREGQKFGERFIPLRTDFERYMVKQEIEGRAPDGLAQDGKLEATSPQNNNQ